MKKGYIFRLWYFFLSLTETRYTNSLWTISTKISMSLLDDDFVIFDPANLCWESRSAIDAKDNVCYFKKALDVENIQVLYQKGVF